ncbi:MAG: hypothetical protein ABW215_03910 [Kibdelosporangium sp.]
MRNFREIFESLASGPLGASADGGRIGVGLSAAMARAQQGLSDQVESYLRDNNSNKADAKTSS